MQALLSMLVADMLLFTDCAGCDHEEGAISVKQT
jgi:hypothetical protein